MVYVFPNHGKSWMKMGKIGFQWVININKLYAEAGSGPQPVGESTA